VTARPGIAAKKAPGPQITADPGPKSVTVGTPTTRPRCAMPVSGHTRRAARASTCHSCAIDSVPSMRACAGGGAMASRIARSPGPALHTIVKPRPASAAASARQRSGGHSLSGELAPTCSTACGAAKAGASRAPGAGHAAPA
jgi:hypothetical protein